MTGDGDDDALLYVDPMASYWWGHGEKEEKLTGFANRGAKISMNILIPACKCDQIKNVTTD